MAGRGGPDPLDRWACGGRRRPQPATVSTSPYGGRTGIGFGIGIGIGISIGIGKGELKLSSQPQYQLGMYVEHVGARAQFGSLLTRAPTRAMLMSESRAQYFVIWGRFAKLLQLRMLKPVSKAELVGMFQSGMPEVFADRAPAELRQDAEALVKLIDRDLAEGQELRIHISEQAQIDLYLDGQKKVGPLNPKLARHLLEIWFGYHSAARVLRQVLVDKIEVLKTPVSKPAK